MKSKILGILFLSVVVLLLSGVSLAAVNIGNTICPVTGGNISKKSNLTSEYKGKVYNFCCPGCPEEFQKDPKKYISKFKVFEVSAEQFKFTPDMITVNKGDIVKIILTSKDVSHGLLIKEYGVDVVAKAKGTKEIQFLADKSGKFQFVCSAYCGPKHSQMKGTFIVK